MSVHTNIRTEATELRPLHTPFHQLGHLKLHERVLHRLDELDRRWHRRRDGREQWSFQCPAHDDRKASGEFGYGEDDRADSLGIWCWGGCSDEEIMEALHLPMSALFPRGQTAAARAEEKLKLGKRGDQAMRRSCELQADADRLAELEKEEGWTAAALDALGVGRYGDRLSIPEQDARGRVCGQLLYLPKSRREGGSLGAHSMEPGGERGLVYPLSGIPRGSRIIVVEGAPCAIAAISLGAIAVGLPGASSSFRQSWVRLLADCEVIVLPDPDPVGIDAGRRVAEALVPVAASVALVRIGNPFIFALSRSDLAEILRREGPEKTSAHLEAAISGATLLERPKRGRPPIERKACEQYLELALRDGKWHVSKDIEANRPRKHYERKVSIRTFEEAKKQLGIESRKELGKKNGKHEIRLPLENEKSQRGSEGKKPQ